MAAGSHAENGIWALFVQAPTKMQKSRIFEFNLSLEAINKKFHCKLIALTPMAKRSSTSPSRFVRAVIIPALKDFLL